MTEKTTPTSLSLYDFTNWKPMKPEAFIDAFGAAFLTIDEPMSVNTTIEVLPSGSFRLTVHARCTDPVPQPPEDLGVVPYLVVIFHPEGDSKRPNLCFERQGVELFMP